MSKTASTDSQLCSSLASELSTRSFPVFVLYSLNAASRIDLNWEDNTSVWEDDDMTPAMGGLLVRMADRQVCGVSESRVKYDSDDHLLIFIWEKNHRLVLLV